MSFSDRRKQRQRGRYKNTDFVNLAEANAFAVMGPLPKDMPVVFMDKFMQGRELNKISINSGDYAGAIRIWERTFEQ